VILVYFKLHYTYLVNIPQNWISTKIKIKNSPLGGKGLFSVESIKKGEKVVVWGGVWKKDYTDRAGTETAKLKGKLIMQWDDNLFSVEIKGDDDSYFINHSCDPTLWMDDAFTLTARKNIDIGQELTADYAMWEADENYISNWECNCGYAKCRKHITGRDWRLPSLQKRYKNHFSPLINKRIKATKNLTHTINTKVWIYPGDSPWHFVTIEKDDANEIKKEWSWPRRGFGAIPVKVAVGKTTWKTSIFPEKTGTYLLPLKKEVRLKEGIKAGDRIQILLQVLI
jgi:uncharacterized protein